MIESGGKLTIDHVSPQPFEAIISDTLEPDLSDKIYELITTTEDEERIVPILIRLFGRASRRMESALYHNLTPRTHPLSLQQSNHYHYNAKRLFAR